MGRGRAKAKQTRIARELKYADTGGDLARLQAELQAAHSVDEEALTTGPEADESLDEE